jgi:triosephosphate isomerase
MRMQKYVVANWKMNPQKTVEAKKVFTGTKKGAHKVKGVEVVVCPPYVFLPELAKELKSTKVKLGVQDIFYKDKGAFTGEVSADMVKGYKATYAILGHSERRELGEDNELVADKVESAIVNGFAAVLCVGERERNDDGQYYQFVGEEIRSAIARLKRKDLAKLVIAYEPIWAIGKSADEAMQPGDLFEMVLFIRKILTEKFGRAPAGRIPILYGGSVKADNTEAFIQQGGVDGLLVGSASLDPKEFTNIITTAAAA